MSIIKGNIEFFRNVDSKSIAPDTNTAAYSNCALIMDSDIGICLTNINDET